MTLGVLASIAPDTWLDRAIRVVMSVIYAAPVFWTGQVLMLLFALKLGLCRWLEWRPFVSRWPVCPMPRM